MPGPGYWGPEAGQPQYNTITSALAQMGSLMGTDPVDGTTGGMDSAIEAWLGSFYGVGDFVVCSFVASGSYSPVFSDMALLALGDSLVIPVIGWYKSWNEAPEEVKEALLSILGYLPTGFYRNGGYVLSLAKAKNDFQFQQIGFQDPASDNGSTSDQSPFVTDIYHVVEESHNFDGEARTQSKRVRTFVPRDFDGAFPLGAGLFKKDLVSRGGFQAAFPLYKIERDLTRAKKTDALAGCHNLGKQNYENANHLINE